MLLGKMGAVSPMTSDKKHAPDSLKYQWKLLGLVQRADWATGLDKSIAYEVIDNYYSKFGNSRTSLRYLEKAAGAARQNVIVSLRRLCENGPFSVARKGSGVRPTEYNLHFDRVAENASGHADSTASDDFPSGHAGITTGGHADDTSRGASGHADVTESVLPVPAYKADVLDRMNDPAAPTAPPLADGLSATAAGVSAVEELAHTQAEQSPVEPTFEAIWRAYGHAKGKKEARAAWNALAPDTDRTAVIEAAAAWQASWAAQGKPDAPRYTLARWLADERFDEDAPTGYQPKERAKAKSAGRGEFGVGANIKHFTITAHESDGDVFADWYETFAFRANDGQEFTKRMHVVCASAEFGEGKDRELRNELRKAAFGKGNDEGKYVGRVVGITDVRGLAFFNVGQPALQGQPEPELWIGDVDKFAPFGTFPAKVLDSACDWNENGQFVTLLLDITDCAGGMEINRQVKHTFDIETAKGQAFLASVCRAVGISEIEDLDVLHGKVLECTITDRGAISYEALAMPLRDAA